MPIRSRCGSGFSPLERSRKASINSRRTATGHSASNRVNRGGSFDNDAANLRAGNRNNDTPSDADNNLGVRCASSSARQKCGLHGRRIRPKGVLTSAGRRARLRAKRRICKATPPGGRLAGARS